MYSISCFICSLIVGMFNAGPDQIIGTWLTAEGESKIEVYKRGDLYYGKITWIDESVEPEGVKKKDVNNPDPSLRDRYLVGTNIVKKLEWDPSEQEWNKGEIYDPKSGNTYSVFAKLTSKNVLYIKGYIGFSLLGRSTEWRRVE